MPRIAMDISIANRLELHPALGRFNINDLKGEYAVYADAVYN